MKGALRDETWGSLEIQCRISRGHDLAGCERTGCARIADLGPRVERARCDQR